MNNKSLIKIGISCYKELGSNEACIISNIISRNSTLLEIDLKDLKFSSEYDTDAVIRALNNNTTLLRFSLDFRNRKSPAKHFEGILRGNKSLIKFDIIDHDFNLSDLRYYYCEKIPLYYVE